MRKGNPNPSPATRFGAGQVPPHYQGEHWDKMRENAARAAHIRGRMLDAVSATVELRHQRLEDEGAEVAAAENAEFFAKSGITKLLREVEDAAKPTIHIKGAQPAALEEQVSDMELAKAVAAALLGTDLQAADLAGINHIDEADVIEAEAKDVTDAA